AEAFRLVQQPRVRRNRWLQVGLGWFLFPVRSTGLTALWHNGGTGGFASYAALLPAADAGVVVLADTARRSTASASAWCPPSPMKQSGGGADTSDGRG